MISVHRVNHLVLYVKDLEQMVDFYQRHLGLHVVERFGDQAAFLGVRGSSNHHDLGLIVNAGAETPTTPITGLYHFAWEVASIDDLVSARQELQAAGVLAGESDHGTSLSLYSKDPEGNEFEIFWPIPQSEWEERGFGVAALDLAGEVKRRNPGKKTEIVS